MTFVERLDAFICESLGFFYWGRGGEKFVREQWQENKKESLDVGVLVNKAYMCTRILGNKETNNRNFQARDFLACVELWRMKTIKVELNKTKKRAGREGKSI